MTSAATTIRSIQITSAWFISRWSKVAWASCLLGVLHGSTNTGWKPMLLWALQAMPSKNNPGPKIANSRLGAKTNFDYGTWKRGGLEMTKIAETELPGVVG